MAQFKFIWYKPWKILPAAFEDPTGFFIWLFSQVWARFALIGLLATISYFLLGLLFVYVFRLPVLLGNTLAYILAFLVSYLGQSKFTFNSDSPHTRQLWRFASTQGIALLLNSAVIDICNRSRVSYMFSMILAILLVPVPVYLLCKFWVFRKKNKEA